MEIDWWSDFIAVYWKMWALSLPEADAPPRSLLDVLEFETSIKTAFLSYDYLQSYLLSNTILSFKQ
jgi:hypothetical protein